MLPSLQSQALKVVANKSTKQLCKVVYKLRVHDYLVAAKISQMTLPVNNGQYIWGHGQWNTYIVDADDPIYVIEKLRFVRCWQSLGDFFNKYRDRYKAEEKLFITIQIQGQVKIRVSQQYGANYKQQYCCIRSQVAVGLNLLLQLHLLRVYFVACQDLRHQAQINLDKRGVIGEQGVEFEILWVWVPYIGICKLA